MINNLKFLILTVSLTISSQVVLADARVDEITQEIQLKLNSLGFDSGSPDGIFGPKTERALKRFYESQGGEFDGTLDQNELTDLKTATSVSNSNLEISAVNAGADQTVEEQETVTLSGSGTDSDGSIASYSWTQTAGRPVTLTNAGSATVKFVAPDITSDETLTFQLTVTDNLGNSADDSIDIKVNKFFDNNIILRVNRVTEDWMAYADHGGWTLAVPAGHKESEAVKYFEVAIWEDTASIHLYAFDNNFDPNVRRYATVPAREAYRLLKFEGLPPENDYQARSEFLRDSFIDISNYIVNQYPSADHHLIFSGHGGPGGRLFEGQLDIDDAALFLESWTLSLGHNLGVIDMGGPCAKGSLADLKNFCQYTDYYIASDLPNGGFDWDEWTMEKYDETHHELQYPQLFTNSINLKEVLVKRINLSRKSYEYGAINITENKVEQGNYLYSCSSYKNFNEAFSEFIHGKSNYTITDDLLHYLESNNASNDLINKFNEMILYSVNTKDFFEWKVERNGLLMDDPD